MLKKLIRPSTRNFSREARELHGFSFLKWLHAYIYCRWPYDYIGIAIGEHRLSPAVQHTIRGFRRFQRAVSSSGKKGDPHILTAMQERRRDADRYHGKVLTPDAARDLVTLNTNIRLENLEKVIPYNIARDIILQNPDHILALRCPCRSNRTNPCQPLDVCLVVGEPFASFIAEHHPDRSRWLESEAVLDILQVEHERGHVHHAFFQDLMLDRFYGICNCCPCCCGAMEIYHKGVPMLASSGYVCQQKDILCTGCGYCLSLCPFGALESAGEKVAVTREVCMGCGVCVSHCPHDALSLVRDPANGDPLEIHELMAGEGSNSNSPTI